MSRLSGNGRRGMHRGCWETSYDEEMGAKTTHLSPALPPRSPIIMRQIHSNFIPPLLLYSHHHLPRFPLLKQKRVEVDFLLEIRTV